MDLTRDALHYNFLKNVIFRLDFRGVFESELESIIPDIKAVLKEKGFTSLQTKIKNDFNLDIPIQSPSTPNLLKANEQKIYSFLNIDQGLKVDISLDNICIVVNSTTYIPFESYSELLINLFCIFRSKIDFISVTRLGLRKQNICSVYSIEDINKYFDSYYFNYYDKDTGAINVGSNTHSIINIDDYKINLLRVINHGKIDDRDAYNLRLDIDIYIDDSEKILSILSDTAPFKKMNELSFNMFIKALTKEFIDKLTDENDVDFDDIIGVERND